MSARWGWSPAGDWLVRLVPPREPVYEYSGGRMDPYPAPWPDPVLELFAPGGGSPFGRPLIQISARSLVERPDGLTEWLRHTGLVPGEAERAALLAIAREALA